MTTPVLTKKQQRHSLSAKKGPAKGLRNILAQPNLNFWYFHILILEHFSLILIILCNSVIKHLIKVLNLIKDKHSFTNIIEANILLKMIATFIFAKCFFRPVINVDQFSELVTNLNT